MRYKLVNRTFVESHVITMEDGEDKLYLPRVYYEIFDWSKDAEIIIIRTLLDDEELIKLKTKTIVLTSNNLDDFY